MTPNEIQAAPRSVWERVARKIFYKSYLFIKVFSNIKPSIKEVNKTIFGKAAHLFLAALLKK